MLGIMSEISMDLIGNVFGDSVAGNFVAKIIGESGPTGIMETVTQQLGLDLMLSTLLITVPPMTGMWFNGVMGQFNAYSPLTDRWNANAPVPQHIDGGRSYQQQVENRVTEARQKIQGSYDTPNQVGTRPFNNIDYSAKGSNSGSQSSDQFKSPSQMNTDNLK